MTSSRQYGNQGHNHGVKDGGSSFPLASLFLSPPSHVALILKRFWYNECLHTMYLNNSVVLYYVASKRSEPKISLHDGYVEAWKTAEVEVGDERLCSRRFSARYGRGMG